MNSALESVETVPLSTFVSPMDPAISPEAITQAANWIRSSQNAVVLTGAGISTPSGIPDFRSHTSGLWARNNPMEVASLAAFRHAPERFFEWIRPLASQIFAAVPNAAHQALASLENAGQIQTVITQNIDRLHQRAGSQNVLEVHGSVGSLTCVSCFHPYPAEDFLEPWLQTGAMPRCPQCGGILKPDVILFDEQLPVQTWRRAEKASRTADMMIVAGSSLEVMPAAALPLKALEHRARLIVINFSETYLNDRADLVFREDVAEVLPRLAAEVLDGP